MIAGEFVQGVGSGAGVCVEYFLGTVWAIKDMLTVTKCTDGSKYTGHPDGKGYLNPEKKVNRYFWGS